MIPDTRSAFADFYGRSSSGSIGTVQFGSSGSGGFPIKEENKLFEMLEELVRYFVGRKVTLCLGLGYSNRVRWSLSRDLFWEIKKLSVGDRGRSDFNCSRLDPPFFGLIIDKFRVWI